MLPSRGGILVLRMQIARLLLGMSFFALVTAASAQVSRERQASLSPDDVLRLLLEGNARFVAARPRGFDDISARRAAAVSGQHPKAVILSCLDSRVPVEAVFDQGIGDIFVGRVAGNVEDSDQLGSMEFATKLAGAKLVMVLGHTSCGAVRGAIDDAKLGHLTGLLAKIRGAVKTTDGGFAAGERKGTNPKFVDAVAAENVRRTIASIRRQSPILSRLEKSGAIRIVGGMCDLASGKVTLLD